MTVVIDPVPVEIPPGDVLPDAPNTGPETAGGAPGVAAPVAGQMITVELPDGTFVTRPLNQYIPAQGTPTVPSDLQPTDQTIPVWGDWFAWVKNGFSFTPSSDPTTLDLKAVIDAFQEPMKRMLQVVATHVNFLADGEAIHDAQIQDLYVLEFRDWISLQTQINFLEKAYGGTINKITQQALPQIRGEIAGLRRLIQTTATGTITIMQRWTTENVAAPLLQLIGNEQAHRIAGDTQIRTVAIPAAKAEAAAALAPVAVTAALALRLAQQNQAWVDDCGEPMCQVMGPKTDLGKLLKGLSGALDLLALAELASWTFPELEQKLADGIQHAASIVAEFETYFSSGTKTIGEIFAEQVTGA